MRCAVFLPLALATSLIVGGCTAPNKGALVLAISTDMQAPKDIDVVSIYIETDGVPKFDYMGRVLPDGTVSLPSTLAVVEPDDPNAQVRIRVTAFQTQADGSATARVLRDILTTVPHERTALMRVPLSFLDVGQVTGVLPAQYVPDATRGVFEGETSYGPTDPAPNDPGYLNAHCPYSQGMTSVAGQCVPVAVDSAKAPDYSDNQVFGDGGSPDHVACFPVDSCFQQGAIISTTMITKADDGSCSFPIAANETGENWNCALETTDGTGTCIGPGGGPPCLVPLESDPGAGFTVQPGTTVTMVTGVCNKLFTPDATGATPRLWLDRASCATKVQAAPVCQPGATGMSPMPTADGGAPAQDASAVASDGGTTLLDSSTSIPDAGHDATAGGDAGTPPMDAAGGATDGSSAAPDASSSPAGDAAAVKDASLD